MSKHLLSLAIIVGLLCACGVKGPPIAPSRDEVTAIYDCSPYDVKCAAKDPNYVPGLDPANPEHAKRIKALEEAYQRQKAKQ